ncbi:MAG: leucine-rich repeat domain-containing protein [Ignavibacteriae bacterium]|nr:leucine-rich repeat domain-containing protein [Ignavibacteriota bacterium]
MLIKDSFYEEVPPEISLMSDLKELRIVGCLELNYNNLFDNLKKNNLIKLSLELNNLTTIPKNISELKTIEYVSFCNNFIEDVPKELLELNDLRILHLISNNILRFETFPNRSYSIEHLSLAQNNLKTLPQGIENLKNLKRLNLSDNPELELEDIIDFIDDFVELEMLFINGCKPPKGIPKNIEILKKVKYISGHDIFSIDELKKLREMGINISIPKTDW